MTFRGDLFMEKQLPPELFKVSRVLVQRCLEALHIPIIADDISLPYSTEIIINDKKVLKIYVEISLEHISPLHLSDLHNYQFFVYFYPDENKASLSLFKKSSIEQSYSGIFYTTYDFSSTVF